MDRERDFFRDPYGSYGGDRAHEGGYRRPAKRAVTDYGSSMAHWWHHKRSLGYPYHGVEAERYCAQSGPKVATDVFCTFSRPSPSYVVDVMRARVHASAFQF